MKSLNDDTDESLGPQVDEQPNSTDQNGQTVRHKYNTRLAKKNRQIVDTSSRDTDGKSFRSNSTNADPADNAEYENPTETQSLCGPTINSNMETIRTSDSGSSDKSRLNQDEQSGSTDRTDVSSESNQTHAATQNSQLYRTGISGKWIIILGLPLFCWYFYPTMTTNDPNENLKFTTYYDMADLKRYFETEKTNDCDSMIIFRPSLPQMILKSDYSASSFMTLAKYGSGKTLLRCEYMKSLSSNNYMKVVISNEQITEYFDRYVSKINRNESNYQTQNSLKNWSENEFAQVLLSTLVTQFIDTYYQHNFKDRDLVLDKKIKLIIIICYYYNTEGTSKLADFINSLLEKGVWSKYKIEDIKQQLRQENAQDDEQLWEHSQEDLEKFTILRQDFERLLLLLFVLRGEKFEDRALEKQLYGNTIQDLIEFSSFIKKSIKKTPVFIVDGIDDNKVFVRDNEVNTAALESFCRSSISSSIVIAALSGHFYLSLFYPKIDNINLENIIIPKDKFLVHTIDWNKNSLMNYADYVLSEMNKNASSTRCKPIPDFKTLVNYSNEEIAKIIDIIPGPKALQIFMLALAEELDRESGSADRSYLPSLTNVKNAYRKSVEFFDKKANADNSDT